MESHLSKGTRESSPCSLWKYFHYFKHLTEGFTDVYNESLSSLSQAHHTSAKHWTFSPSFNQYICITQSNNSDI